MDIEYVSLPPIGDHILIPGLKEVICETLREEFDVKTCPNGYYWFTPWDGHCRKVINMQVLKGYLNPLYWGYNFDFIPFDNSVWSDSGTVKLMYHRTDKAVTIDCGGSAAPYIGYDRFDNNCSLSESMEIRKKYYVQSMGSDTEEFRDMARKAVRNNIPFMKDWFDRIKTIDDMIECCTGSIESAKKTAGFPIGGYWTRAFLRAKQHDIDGAVSDINMVYSGCSFRTPRETPEKVLKKLYEVDKMQ